MCFNKESRTLCGRMTLMLTKVEVTAANGEAFEKNSYVALKKNLYFATLQTHTWTRVRT